MIEFFHNTRARCHRAFVEPDPNRIRIGSGTGSGTGSGLVYTGVYTGVYTRVCTGYEKGGQSERLFSSDSIGTVRLDHYDPRRFAN